MKALSATMRRHLVTLANTDGARGAYPSLSLATLGALETRKLVTAKRELGSMWFPNTHIKWALTQAGKDEAAKIEKEWSNAQ